MSVEESNAASTPSMKLVVVLCFLAQAFTVWAVFFFPPIAVLVAAELELDPVTVGYQTGLLFLFTLCLTLYSGTIIDRIGPSAAMLLGMALTALGLCLYAFGTFSMVFVGSMFVGASFSLINPSSLVLLRTVTEDSNRGFVFSLKQSSVPVGMLFSSFIGTTLAAEYGWRFALIPPIVMLIVLSVAQALLLSVMNPRPSEIKKRGVLQPLHSLASLWRNRPLLLLALAGTVLSICQGSVVTFTSNLFADERGLSLQTAGLILAFVQLGAIAGRLGSGLMADRIQDINLTLRIISILIVLALGIITFLPAGLPVSVWCALYFLLGTVVMGWNGLLIAEFAQNIIGRHPSEQMSGAFFLLFSGGSIGSFGFAYAHQFSSSYAYTMGAFVCFFALVAYFLLRSASPGRRDKAVFQPMDTGL